MELFSKKRWIDNHKNYMHAARQCRETLADTGSHWGYAADDERMKKAVGTWVTKAREAHRIAMGRRPVIANAVIIDNAGVSTGSMCTA